MMRYLFELGWVGNDASLRFFLLDDVATAQCSNSWFLLQTYIHVSERRSSLLMMLTIDPVFIFYNIFEGIKTLSVTDQTNALVYLHYLFSS